MQISTNVNCSTHTQVLTYLKEEVEKIMAKICSVYCVTERGNRVMFPWMYYWCSELYRPTPPELARHKQIYTTDEIGSIESLQVSKLFLMTT